MRPPDGLRPGIARYGWSDGGSRVLLARAMGTTRGLMRIDGVVAAVGEAHIFPTVRDAVDAAANRAPTRPRSARPTAHPKRIMRPPRPGPTVSSETKEHE